ncbi:MAG: GNAT family N-acetyltransferase [Alphaproteobacteria bacterium]|nr:GNAT family N-acetyltransferase [Alphaproteobacteria bacterium]MBV8412603.1 GNAT family N-acetyltransferase [Alphaproteobacteria bacterium]
MANESVTSATAEDKAVAIAVLTLAFAGDPATRWTWPDPKGYLTAFARFAEAFGGAAFAKGSAHYIDGAATALWLPPGSEPDEAAMVELFEATADPATANDGPQVMQQMASYHPREPHWYLPLLGVDPARQGQGLGGRLLEHATRLFDRDGAVAYLESSNPRNVSLYQRHGFEELGRIQVGSSPVFTPMRRDPR